MYLDGYPSAAELFRRKAHQHDGILTSHRHPITGPDGEAIALDIASFGSPAADRMLVVTSGTHGIEGFAGSGIQSSLIGEGISASLAEGVRLLLVHAVNPFGFAWRRRVNEDNIDLNRNFIDHDQTKPANDNYAALAATLAPTTWDDTSRGAIVAELGRLATEHSQAWLQAAITGGQYDHPDGFFYGGARLAWSNSTMAAIADRELSSARHVVLIDIHTGLGDYSAAECIVEYPPGSPQATTAEAIWGSRTRNTLTGESASAAVNGSMVGGLSQRLGASSVGTGLEFGTSPMTEVMLAMLADQWLHNYGELDSAIGKSIKDELTRVFYPDDERWRESILDTARSVVGQALDYVTRA